MAAGCHSYDGALFLSDVLAVLRLGVSIKGSDVTSKYFHAYDRSLWIQYTDKYHRKIKRLFIYLTASAYLGLNFQNCEFSDDHTKGIVWKDAVGV
jgi:hypothetical protein